MNSKTFALITSLLLLASATALQAGDGQVRPMRYEAAVEGKIAKGRLYRLPLKADVLGKSENRLSDVRISDQSGREVPYLILDNIIPAAADENYPADLLSFEERSGEGAIMLEQKEPLRTVNRLVLATEDRDFQKTVIVAGSNDGRRWTPVGSDRVYDFSSRLDLRRVYVPIRESAYRYYRLTLKEPRKDGRDGHLRIRYEGLDIDAAAFANKKLKVSAFILQYHREGRESVVFDELSMTPQTVENTKERATEIEFETSIPFRSIRIVASTPYYHRPVTFFGSGSRKKDDQTVLYHGSIRNLSIEGKADGNSTIYLPAPVRQRSYRLVIGNGSDRPLKVEKIVLQWPQKQLFFVGLADGDRYTFHTGDPTAREARYDLADEVKADNWFKQEAQSVNLSPLVSDQGYKPTGGQSRAERLVLICMIGLVVIVAGFFLFRLWRRV